ncbi:MAG: ATP-binding domain-containing protein, partial [Flavobacteriales bacterium]|nr:ATP-binding domain-containing protein [Flavobacteriales bacterium]
SAKVLANYSKRFASTIHREIYRGSTDSMANSSYSVKENRNHNTYFIVDEASMIGESKNFIGAGDLLDDLIKYVYSGKGCRIVFIGDVAQLPPIGSELSPALEPRTLRDSFQLRIKGSELKQVIRQQEDSIILKNATSLRNSIEKRDVSVLQLDIQVYKDVSAVAGVELEERLEASYSEYGFLDTIVLCKSNKRANLFNQQIRARIRWYEEQVESGDLLMVVKNNYFWLKDEEGSSFIANGDIIQVTNILGREDIYGFSFVDISMKMVDQTDQPEYDVKVMLDTIDIETPALDKDKSKDLYTAISEDYQDLSSKARLEAIKSNPYFNALQIKYAYAITCHKAQGGQWKSVFIDQGYLTEEMVDKSYVRWIYTAVTRASEKLCFVNFDAKFFKESPYS